MNSRTVFLIIALSVAQASAQGLRDPTRPLTASSNSKAVTGAAVRVQAPALPQLQMILIGAERSKAVIDGELVEVGELFKGMRIEAIRPDAVVLKTRKGLRTLPLLALEEK